MRTIVTIEDRLAEEHKRNAQADQTGQTQKSTNQALCEEPIAKTGYKDYTLF